MGSAASSSSTRQLRSARGVTTLTRVVRPLIRPGLLLAVAVAVVALPTVASGAFSAPAAPQAPAANTTTYQDSVGEDSTAPDITTIVASNDNGGLITFRINIPNRPQLAQDLAVIMFLDSDSNPGTGDPESFGADYIIQYIRGEAILFRWDGSDYSLSPIQSTLTAAWSNGPTFRINASQLGNTRKLSFDIVVVSGLVIDLTTGAIECPEATCKRDFAPTVGFYQYEVKITPATLVVRSLKPTPKNPTAGRSFTLRLVAARSDTNAVVQNGRVTCVGRVGSARLKAQVQRVLGGAATCTWNLPPSAKGKTFRGSVGVVFEGLRAAQSFSGKVR